MLNIIFSRSFLRQAKKLTHSQRKKLTIAIQKFEKNPKDASLRAHKLTGKLDDLCSFSVGYHLRVVFEINKKRREIYLLKVGGHEIYK